MSTRVFSRLYCFRSRVNDKIMSQSKLQLILLFAFVWQNYYIPPKIWFCKKVMLAELPDTVQAVRKWLLQYLANNCSDWCCNIWQTAVHSIVSISCKQLLRLTKQALPYNCSDCCCNIWHTKVQAEVASSAIQLFRMLLQYMADNCSGWCCKLFHATVQTVVAIYERHQFRLMSQNLVDNSHCCFNI